MIKVKYIVKMVESCVTCEYSESNFHSDIFRCKKYNLDLKQNKDRKFHKDCRLLDSNSVIFRKENI